MPLNKTITKKLFILFLLLFSVCNGQAQTTQQALSFGEGIISIGQFNFPPGGTIPPWPTYFTKELMPYNFTYYIKGDKIFRKDNLDNIPPTETNDTLKQNGRDLVTTLKSALVHPSYLIDWKTKMIYIFFTKNGKEEITEKPLKDEGIEWFYRLIDSSMSVVKSLTVNYSPVFIAGKKCYKGIAISKVGEYIPFYYTCEPLKVCSPLNAFLPLHFPKDVLSIKFPVDWTTKDVKKLLAQ